MGLAFLAESGGAAERLSRLQARAALFLALSHKIFDLLRNLFDSSIWEPLMPVPHVVPFAVFKFLEEAPQAPRPRRSRTARKPSRRISSLDRYFVATMRISNPLFKVSCANRRVFVSDGRMRQRESGRGKWRRPGCREIAKGTSVGLAFRSRGMLRSLQKYGQVLDQFP